jgi:hypothetical protein
MMERESRSSADKKREGTRRERQTEKRREAACQRKGPKEKGRQI